MNACSERFPEFGELYANVTMVLTRFGSEARRRGQITPDELDWLLDLMQRFTLEYCAWEAPAATPVRDYLALFDEPSVSRNLRLAAHAFLHVAYDLPRAIADSLAATSEPRFRLRSIFVRPAPLFRQVFSEHARRGRLGLLARPLGHVKAAEILAYWLLSLRSVAWIHAEVLVDALDRPTLESNLAQGLLKAGQAAREFSGLLGVPRLDNSTVLQVGTPLMLTGLLPAAGMVAALAAAIYVRVRNEALANRLAFFGTRVFIESTRAIGVVEESLRDSSI